MTVEGFAPPTAEEVRAAAGRLDGQVLRTSLLESAALNRTLGGRLLLKAECLQHTGSFKFRGALHALGRLTDLQKRGGVVAYSSGNHARAVAEAARLLGVHATIVMPADAPAVKLESTLAAGARVVLYDRVRESREVIAGRSVSQPARH